MFNSFVFRKSGRIWVALCLENGLVGQGATKAAAAARLEEAIASCDEVADHEDIYQSPISVKELHEFLTFDAERPATSSYELRAVYA